jgi:hypothetical protein
MEPFFPTVGSWSHRPQSGQKMILVVLPHPTGYGIHTDPQGLSWHWVAVVPQVPQAEWE